MSERIDSRLTFDEVNELYDLAVANGDGYLLAAVAEIRHGRRERVDVARAELAAREAERERERVETWSQTLRQMVLDGGARELALQQSISQVLAVIDGPDHAKVHKIEAILRSDDD